MQTRCALLVDLGCGFEGRLVAHCTLRLLNPECHLDSDWSAEPLALQSARAVSLLYADSIESSLSSLLSAPAVSYCFPLLRAVVMSRKNLEQDELLLVKCLDILSTHAANLRSVDPHSEVFICVLSTVWLSLVVSKITTGPSLGKSSV